MGLRPLIDGGTPPSASFARCVLLKMTKARSATLNVTRDRLWSCFSILTIFTGSHHVYCPVMDSRGGPGEAGGGAPSAS